MGYDSGDFLAALERESVRPHVAVRAGRIIAEDEGGDARRRARARQRNAGYWRSQRRRKIVEELFGWSKTEGGLRRSRHAGRWKIAQQVELTAYNLVRMRRLLAA